MEDIKIILDCILVLVSIIMLWKGADWMVDSAAEIAHTFHISDLIIGLTVVAFGTSAPEFATSISAALKGRHGIALGNLIGSDLFNLLGVLGLAGIINPTYISEDIYSSTFLLVIMVGLTLFRFVPIGKSVVRKEQS